jgi:hypothetical protein
MEEMHRELLLENLKERQYMEDLSTDGKITL